MGAATHMLRAELFDLSDTLNQLNELLDRLHDADGIKVLWPKRIPVRDSNNDVLGRLERCADEDEDWYVFVPCYMGGPNSG